MSKYPKDWKVALLHELTENLDSQRVPIKSSDRESRKGPYKYYGASGVIDSISDYIFEEDLILVGEDGANIIDRNKRIAFKISGKTWVNNHAHVLRPLESVNIDFLTEYLESLDYRKIASGSAQPKITRGSLDSIKVVLPSLAEQRKIAEIISTFDEQIFLLESQIRQAKNTRISLAKRLFSMPQENFLPLSEVAFNYDSQRVPVSSAERECRRGRYRYFGASGVIDMIDDYLFDGDFILIGEDGANIIERNKPLAFRVSGKFWVNNHAHIIQPKDVCDLSYLSHYLESLDYADIASGSAQPKITRASLDSIQIPIPPIEDQKKIGAVIDSTFNFALKMNLKKDKLLSIKSAILSDLLSGRKRFSV